MSQKHKDAAGGLSPYLSPLGAWALAFGCAVGWGSFVMPGSTFLPIAGPWGTVLGLIIGAGVIMLIGWNYHYLMNRYPDSGGTYTYTKKTFGYDHGFLNAWFLILTYVAIIWANATALPLIARNVLGNVFQVGLHYEIAGFQIYLGEIGLSIAAMALCALICLRRSVSAVVQIIMAFILLGGVIICFSAAMSGNPDAATALEPAYPPDTSHVNAVFSIVALAPWAFVGFESVSHSSEEMKFSRRNIWLIFAIALTASAIAYIFLSASATTALPEGFDNWTDYIAALGSLDGPASLPTFYAAKTALGDVGTTILGLAALGGIITGLVGNMVASSRLLYNMGRDRLIPEWFGRVDRNKVPRNAIVCITLISFIIPFFGRTATSWIVDVTTVGAAVVYAYTSATAIKNARVEKQKFYFATGVIGLGISVLFIILFLVPNLLAVKTLATESYLILAAWSVLGFLVFRQCFKHDEKRWLGRSTVVWIVLIALIILTSAIWVRQSISQVVESFSVSVGMEASEQLQDVVQNIGRSVSVNTMIQIGLIVAALVILFSVYSLMQKREKEMEMEKLLAEESSRAKTSFLSNMSHEIRTPMNAIIGLDNIALRDPDLPARTRDQLEKIGASAKHLLSLINDILDMSRIESGRMVLKEEEFSFRDFLDQVNIIVNGQCHDKGLEYECKVIGQTNDYYVGDDMKLRQVLINILGNAVKFTDAPGQVTLTVEQVRQYEGYCTLRFVMEDTGIGMSKEYIPKIFDAFSQENESKVNKYGSTGLGMAITKNIVGMMNGEIEVESEKGVGSAFTVTVTLKSSSRNHSFEYEEELPQELRLLVVDDDIVACEHAQMVARSIGIETSYCTGGEEALAMVRQAKEDGRPFRLLLTDYRMPDMTGIELTARLREFDGGETAVIMMTGYNWDDIQEEADRAGVDDIMSKPLFTDSLKSEIHKIWEKRHQSAGISGGIGAKAAEAAAGSLEGRRVLIAEDIAINADILIDLLEIEGVEAEHAENGRDAVDMFEQSEPGYYDAVLMDIRMPEMDGLEATRAIRALPREDAQTTPIIAMTANAFEDDVQRSLQAGMTAHLSKPVEPERMFEVLRQLIGEK